ncbi:hypothetical protein HMPREF9136_2429 [Prevotella dentalis DSM 3688]|uniref:Uncharacterized protein n=1 Tax=Prevotella dentalis (strain ATCC 49559 / DSM 3688 / JCM 13448 / NCTC 12043 / ES 2772) TaxID=908937 RepID=F9D6F1_PREDD|nr:hypothetical protein HMPREF9136_2429 [Prevotella dentalis DSM 3688]
MNYCIIALRFNFTLNLSHWFYHRFDEDIIKVVMRYIKYGDHLYYIILLKRVPL